MIRFALSVFLVASVWAGTAQGRGETHLRVRATLHNGAKLVGVVRNAALYEVLKDGRFVRTIGPHVRGAGFRLWYVADSPGYLFVHHSDVKKIEQISPMTSAELFRMEKDLRKKARVIILPWRRSMEDRAGDEADVTDGLAEEAPPAPTDDGEPDAGKPVEPAPGSGPQARPEPEKPPRQLTPGELLLEKFPPERGWLPERRGEIERRKWVLGIFPTPEEREFLENYPVWKEAYDAWLSASIEKTARERLKKSRGEPKAGKKGSRDSQA